MKEPIMYSQNHLWLSEDGDTIKIGLTEYALKKMKSIVFLTLPDSGETLYVGEPFGDIESLKTVSELISPINGMVVEANTDLAEEPEVIDRDPEKSWLIVAKVTEFSDQLITLEEYTQFTESE